MMFENTFGLDGYYYSVKYFLRRIIIMNIFLKILLGCVSTIMVQNIIGLGKYYNGQVRSLLTKLGEYRNDGSTLILGRLCSMLVKNTFVLGRYYDGLNTF